MKLARGTKLTITLTQERALQLDLVRCECGHAESNHFDHGTHPCARCDCREYTQYARKMQLGTPAPLSLACNHLGSERHGEIRWCRRCGAIKDRRGWRYSKRTWLARHGHRLLGKGNR